MTYEYLKALHIIFIVTWFAGLFYIPRLFIYQVEANKLNEPDKSVLQKQFKKMAKPLWYGITWPSMILTYVFGWWVAWELLLKDSVVPPWFILKVALVFGLTLYHFSLQYIYNQFRKDNYIYSSLKLRIWNEVATLFLVSIVFVVVFKNSGNWIWGLVGLVVFALILMIAIRLYKTIRARKEEKNNVIIEKQKDVDKTLEA